MKDVAEVKQHATLGASKAHIWMACPGSVALAATLPTPPTSAHAQEGTAAHALAELSLKKGVHPLTFVGTTLEGVAVTDEMAEYVKVFTDYCLGTCNTTRAQYWIERQFNLAAIHPPGPMFGTADFVMYDPETRELEVIDLKYGKGVVVDVFENKQLRYYALGAALSLEGYAIDAVKMTIVQPRAMHKDGVIRSETIPFVELLGFANELLASARATTDPRAPRCAGSHCRWCPASGRCDTQRDRAQSVAMVEFGALPLDLPPNPTAVPMETLAEWAGKFHVLEDWIAACRLQLYGALQRGEQVPGYKLVAKRGNRSWVDEEKTVQYLKSFAVDENDIFTKKIKSPAQIERIVGKKGLPADLTEKKSSGVSMVPESDARPAVTLTAGEEFGLLEGSTEE